jgi:hypothetical protein
LNGFQCVPDASFLHRCSAFWYCLLCCYFPPPVPSNSVVAKMFSCVWSCLHLCIHVSFVSVFHMWEKACYLCLSEPGLLYFTCYSLVPFIYLQAT